MTTISQSNLLIVDDNIDICNLLIDLGQDSGFLTTACQTSQQFMNAYRGLNPEIVIIDLNLIGSDDGIGLLRFLGELKSTAKVILLSGMDEKIIGTAIHLGRSYGLTMLAGYQKPVDVKILIELLRDAKGASTGTELSVSRLQEALRAKEFVLYYQPIVDLHSETIHSVEALVRLQLKGQELMFPDSFIPFCEQSGFIVELTHWVIEESFRQLQALNQLGIDIGMAINCSAKYLTDLDVPERILKMCNAYQLNPSKITLEITETVLMNKTQMIMDILARLRIKGFSLSIDDFGTGFSSLIELYRMPFNELKIDKSFVSELTHDKDAHTITKVILTLAKELNLKTTVAEGIETRETLEALKAIGGHLGQGFYFSKALPAHALIEWIRNANPKIKDILI